MIKLYTIGFTGKSAQKFFNLLEESGVEKIIDTRISANSQLSGFAKAGDLEFFAERICNIAYEHKPEFAPTKELLARYRNKEITWQNYTEEYLNLLAARNIAQQINADSLNNCCLLCSENLPHKCHRRLLAEYLQSTNQNLKVIHLK